jgi:hypothetical protein
MSKNVQGGYYLKATQSIFLVAGILMVFTFPYFLKYFNFSGMALMFIMVALGGARWFYRWWKQARFKI